MDQGDLRRWPGGGPDELQSATRIRDLMAGRQEALC